MLLRPKPLVHIPARLWVRLCDALSERTDGVHESGAFLLGRIRGRYRFVEDVIFYDDLDPDAYRTGVVVLRSSSFGRLWSRCRQARVQVIADIHLHGGAAYQSLEDRKHPMIAQRGHVALILPDFARLPMEPDRIGMFEYLGSHRWRELGFGRISKHLKIGI